MSNTVGRVGSTALPFDHTLAAAAALSAQDTPQAAPAMRGDSSRVRTTGSAATTVSLGQQKGAQEIVYQDEKGNTYTEAQIKQMEREARTERRIGNTIGGAMTIGFGVSTGVAALRAVNTARTAATAVQATATVAKGASALGLVGRLAGKALPGLGIVTGVIGIGSGIMNWNAEGNKRHGDDIARMAGDYLTIAGSAITLTGYGAPIGLGLAAAGLILSGIGMIFDDQ